MRTHTHTNSSGMFRNLPIGGRGHDHCNILTNAVSPGQHWQKDCCKPGLARSQGEKLISCWQLIRAVRSQSVVFIYLFIFNLWEDLLWMSSWEGWNKTKSDALKRQRREGGKGQIVTHGDNDRPLLPQSSWKWIEMHEEKSLKEVRCIQILTDMLKSCP